ncbi:MAG: hypothetical protein AB8B79_21895 [Granulosicoccus sp.]
MILRYKIYVVAIAMIFSSGAIADDFHIGIDFGNLKFDQEFLVDTENIGLVAGYNWNDWGIESVINFSETKSNFSGGDQAVRMYHLYGTYQTEGQYYFKAKFGLTNERYTIDNREGQRVFNDVHSGIARGIGVGFRLNSVKSELEYTWLGGSLELLTFGIRYEF